MLEFRDITLSDRERVQRALTASDFMGCEYSFANNLAWRRLADSKISFYKDFYICGAFGGDTPRPRFILPAGTGSYKEVIGELRRFSEAEGSPLILTSVTDRGLELLSELFPGEYTVEDDRDNSDYIYLRSDLADLSGRKYHAKRNHLARFRELNCEYSLITFIAEQFAINTYFSHFRELCLAGGIIRAEGKIIALTLGERLNSDTFCVHIEKADTAYAGIYAGINNLFVRSSMDGMKYVNREEDLGIEGLRKAKLSYHPAFILRKYTVTFN